MSIVSIIMSYVCTDIGSNTVIFLLTTSTSGVVTSDSAQIVPTPVGSLCTSICVADVSTYPN